ncbi:hypothetical protein ABEB36_012978 [Hypothenemus hampei]|uniref:RNA (guanine-9-)-methyltransferase domain-containing protein 1 n=1 Tax=Hypothenemus hampei TaxID=57062 RepID=A0ABD1E6E0_HYPHA
MFVLNSIFNQSKQIILKTPIKDNLWKKRTFKPFIYQTISKNISVKSNNGEKEGVSRTCNKDKLDAITDGNKELEHKLKVIMLETEVLRQEGAHVPPIETITPEMWKHLLDAPSRSARAKYLTFLFKVLKKKESRLEKKMEMRKAREENTDRKPLESLPIEEHALNYGLQRNNIFLRFTEQTINHFYNYQLIKAMQFGQKLVIDCGYDENMTKRENLNTAKQLMLSFADNRIHKDPFDIHFLNMKKNTELHNMLVKYIPTLYEREFPLNVQEKSYLDLFPKDKLVYLTPHCHKDMIEFDHEAIYIIGGIVDKNNNEPISLAKAKREGLNMRKFPLDRYLQWGSGSGKSLTINQCVSILLDMKTSGDWNEALKHVPRRKIVDNNNNNNIYLRRNRFTR